MPISDDPRRDLDAAGYPSREPKRHPADRPMPDEIRRIMGKASDRLTFDERLLALGWLISVGRRRVAYDRTHGPTLAPAD